MIVLTTAVAEAIRQHGTETYPHECCGLLLGAADGAVKRATRIWPVANVWTDDIALSEDDDHHSLRDRFYIPPKAYLQADRAARADNLDIVGCYHSHPDDRAALSERDRVGAAGVGGGPAFSFVVVAVQDSVPGQIASATLSPDGQHWLSEEILIEE